MGSSEATRSRKFDGHVGRKLEMLRQQRGWSLPTAARRVGISRQQWRKYETGENRAPSYMLSCFAKAFGVSVLIFFDGHDTESTEDYRLVERVRILPQHARRQVERLARSLVNA